jgi:LruC domain-containing protein
LPKISILSMKKSLLLCTLLGLLAIGGCKKENNGTAINSVNDISVPAGFNWESSRYVDFSIDITDTRFGTSFHSIAIYDGDPNAGGIILARGAATTTAPYTNKLYVAKTLSQVYVVKTSPDGAKIIRQLAVSGASVSSSFGATDPLAAEKNGRFANGRTTTPDCSSGCTRTITTSTSSVSVNTGDVVCITGSGISIDFSSVNGGTIRVCGANVTLRNLNLNGAASLIISATGIASVSGLNYNSSAASIENYGTLNGSFAIGGIFTNYGTYNCAGDLNLNATAGAFTNYGTINVAGSFNNGARVIATNKATIKVSGNFQQNGGSAAFVNHCSLIITGNYNQSSNVKNTGFISVNGTTTINSRTELSMINGAMHKTKGFILDGSTIIGTGSTSLLKISGSVSILNSGANITGNMQVCSVNPVDATKLTGGAAISCGVYIPVTDCNTEGNGTPTITDTDRDGIADDLDEYPSDPTKAFNNYYPSKSQSGTLGFEDLWPSKGDFDMNDLVVAYKYQVVTNATNKVVQVTGNYLLTATGGDFGNGFGVQFPVLREQVADLTGGTLEEEQSKAVIIVFNNMRDAMATWNTVPGVTQTPARNYTVTFNVFAGPSIRDFGLTSYNPFIWNYGLGYNRGREIHLPGHLPTDLADQSRYGTQDDNSSPRDNRYYVTPRGLPFAIDVPTAPFGYPIEKTDITQAYLKLADWAASGGTRNTDWYSNTGTGYRNTANIYTR